MPCPNCQTQNPQGARFCLNCGSPLALSCPQCGTSLPPEAKFCFNCGHQLGAKEPSTPITAAQTRPPARPAPSPESRLHQFIPKELLAKLQRQSSAQMSGAVEGERRIVTSLFCDVKGSTAAAGQLDPEEWAQIINGAYEYMIQPVVRYEGMVARLMGDGLLAFFGAPIAHEDDPQRAVLAGWEIVRGIQAYRQEVQRHWGLDFDVRVGINTGLVVVGAVGSDLRMEYTALGDAINLAARMEQTALPGTVQVAEPTYKLVAPLFDFQVLEAVEVKGKAEPVRAYRLLGQKAQPGRLRGIAGLHAPLIGRQPEMEALLAAASELKGGRGQIVSVMGEAGLGKSRLVSEFRQAVAAEPGGEPAGLDTAPPPSVRWVEGRSLSYERATPYAPFVHILAGCLGLESGQSDAEGYEGLKGQVAALFPDRGEEIAPFLGTLLGLELPAVDSERVKYLEPPVLRATVFRHVTALFERLADENPLVLVFDDLHWIDPTSLELVESLLPLTDRAALMIIAAFRPYRQEPSWRLHETLQRDYAHRYTAVTLQPLDSNRSRDLVSSLLFVEDLPEGVRQRILDKAEGNPFFVEEIIRSLLDHDLVVRDNGHWRATQEIMHITIPDTLNGVITARLDRLDETTRQLAQAASVLGREFSFDVLADLVAAPEKLESGLSELQRRGLILAQSQQPQRTFAFKHVMTQEAAYSSVLLSRRRELHRRAAESLQVGHRDRPADIARHFLEARQPARAMPYLVEAGERAARGYATAEALQFFSQALEQRAAVDDLALLQRAYEGMGKALTLSNQIPQAVENYQAMLKLARSLDNMPMQISALNKLSVVAATRLGQFPEAEAYLAQAEQLSAEHPEISGVAETAIVRCMMCGAQADFDGVVKHMGHLVEISQKLGTDAHLAMGLEHVANSLMFLARFDDAERKAEEALAAARRVGDREHEASVLTTVLPVCQVRKGDLDAAQQLAQEGLEIADRIGALVPQVYGNWLLGEIHRWRGEYEQALAYGQLSAQSALPLEPFMPSITVQPLGALALAYLEISGKYTEQVASVHEHALRLLENPAGMMGGGTAWADLGWCSLGVGDLEAAEEAFQKGLNHPSMFMLLERPRYLAGLAQLALVRGNTEEALHQAEEALGYAEERGMRHLYPLLALVAGRVLAARGEAGQALSQFERAEQLALEMKMRPVVWQAQVGAAQVLSATGHQQEAGASLEKAREMIQEIAGLFQEETLRAGFLESKHEQTDHFDH